MKLVIELEIDTLGYYESDVTKIAGWKLNEVLCWVGNVMADKPMNETIPSSNIGPWPIPLASLPPIGRYRVEP